MGDSSKVTTGAGTATLTIAVAAATHGFGRGSTERFTSGAGPQPAGRHPGASGQQHIRLTQRFRLSWNRAPPSLGSDLIVGRLWGSDCYGDPSHGDLVI